MDIKFGVQVGDMLAGYESQPFTKRQLLKMELSGGYLFLDEINVEYSEARRTQSNRNIGFSTVMQMLRKKKLNLVYTVIDEMWIDPRLRELTSIFIKCRDLALKPGPNFLAYDLGSYVEWTVYDMIGILGKGAYADTHEAHGQYCFDARRFWNSYDTDKVQGDEEEYYGEFSVVKDAENERLMPVMTALTEIIRYHQDLGDMEVAENELLKELHDRVPIEDLGSHSIIKSIGAELRKYNVTYGYDNGRKIYDFSQIWSLSDRPSRKTNKKI